MARLCSQAVILCEDQQQEVFIRHFLMKKGYSQRQMRIERCPSGKQAGCLKFAARVNARRISRNP
jgi:hypothetical protein